MNSTQLQDESGKPRSRKKWRASLGRRARKFFGSVCRYVRKIGAAIGNPSRKLFAHFFSPEYTTVNLVNPHLQAIASKYYQRSRRYADTSMILLFAAIAVIAVGIAVFLFPTTLTDARDVEEEIAKNEDEINQLIDDYVKPAQQLSDAEEFHWAVAPFYEVYKTASAVGAIPAVVSSSRPMKDASAILQAIDDDDEMFELRRVDTNYNHSGLRGDKRLSKPTLDRIEDLINRNVVDSTSRLKEVFANLNKATEPDDAWDAAIAAAKKELNWSQTAFADARDEAKTMQARADVERDQAASQLKQIQALTREIARNEIRRNSPGPSSFVTGAFLSVLSIRIGIVVLLVFLTQILLSTYRYTMSLSTFYRARADTLQLIGKTPADGLVDPEEVGKLLEKLAPDQLKLDRVAPPDFTKIFGGMS